MDVPVSLFADTAATCNIITKILVRKPSEMNISDTGLCVVSRGTPNSEYFSRESDQKMHIGMDPRYRDPTSDRFSLDGERIWMDCVYENDRLQIATHLQYNLRNGIVKQ